MKDLLEASMEEFKRFQKDFELLLKKEREQFTIICAFLVFEDTFNVIIETKRGDYEAWSFSMNSRKIKRLASWKRYEHNFDRKWDD
ncbi:MAG: hypothetical protein OCU18_03150 [Candidatus Syntrophoarchaeum sp.]|nr:hypothetical protein [Candidatus Syntrophoarchaeum sp.]